MGTPSLEDRLPTSLSGPLDHVTMGEFQRHTPGGASQLYLVHWNRSVDAGFPTFIRARVHFLDAEAQKVGLGIKV